jgi:hypothetical protein
VTTAVTGQPTTPRVSAAAVVTPATIPLRFDSANMALRVSLMRVKLHMMSPARNDFANPLDRIARAVEDWGRGADCVPGHA